MVVWYMLYLFLRMAVILWRAMRGLSDLTWPLMDSLPAESVHTWKSWISSTSSNESTSVKHWTTSMSLGVASMRMETQSLKMGMVVKMHRNVNRKVQMGSTMCHSGLK